MEVKKPHPTGYIILNLRSLMAVMETPGSMSYASLAVGGFAHNADICMVEFSKPLN